MIMRKVQRRLQVGEGWEDIRFCDLHKGDVFRLFEDDGEPVKGKLGETEFIASGEPYKANARGTNGEIFENVWTIETVPSPGF